MKKALILIAALMFVAVSPAHGANKWVTAYYADWQTQGYPINRIDYSALTHIVLAHWLTNANGTIQSAGWDSTCSSVVGPAHAAGVKVLMMLGGSDDTHFGSAASPTYQATLISSIQAKVSACGLDGVDLDWEDSVNTANFISLAKNLRAASPGFIITAPVDASVQPASLAASLSAYCDQVNMMTYGNANYGNGWVSWYFSALAGDGSTHPDSVSMYVSSWEGAGTPAAKIGVGIGFYMNGWTAPVTGALQSTASTSVPVQELPYGWSLANGGGLLSCYYNQPGGTYQFDASPDLDTEPSTPPQQPSISIPGGISGVSPCPSNLITWVTYEDEASVAAKAQYIVNNNLGGAIIWTVEEGAVDPATGRNPLLDSLKLNLNLNGGGPAPMPQVGNSGPQSVSGPTTITVTGLPSNLGLVDINWWNYTSSVAWDNKTDTGFDTYGQPSAYTIQGSTNGTTWTTLSCTPSCSVTGEHYTGRQFVADLTGTGYTQIRMNIAGIVGAYAGYDVLTVNGQSGTNDSNDTYLMFGDSITANCWGAANNTGPTEQLGTQINAARSSRFPISTVGGQSGWLTSTALDTSTYGIPNIEQFMQDFPAVKFVGISLGTNDANGNVSAATYCSNMQAIVQDVIAAGKTPMIPTIVASPSAAVQANAPAMNACLATLEKNYPSIIVGPDLWTLFKGHSTTDGWFLDSLHPSLGTGCTALQNAWTNTLLSTIYPAGGQPASLTSPSANSTLPGSTGTFTWSGGSGVSAYQLSLGTTGAGSTDVYNVSFGASTTSVTVTGIPTAGAKLYARLWSKINGAWQWTDSTFIEAGAPAPASPASLASPPTSSPLPGSSVTFAWSGGRGVTAYQLSLGTTGVGSTNVYNVSFGASTTSVTVTGIPTAGANLYARLWSKINGAWQWTDSTFIEAGTPAPASPASLASPPTSSPLPGSTVTFTWSGGSGVTAYQLSLGTTGVGSKNVYNSSFKASRTSVTVTVIPTTGAKLYARLWSKINGKWQWKDYVFTEAP